MNVEFPLQEFNVLIGANGIGKSSILDVLHFLCLSAAGGLETAINGMGGLHSLITANGKTDSIALELKTPDTPDAEAVPMEYRINLIGKGYGYEISREFLNSTIHISRQQYIVATGSKVRYLGGKNLVAANWEYKGLETTLSQIPKINHDINVFRHGLMDISEIYHTLDISPRAPVRLPQSLYPAQMLGVNGQDLLPCLYFLREMLPNRYEIIQDSLRAAFPTFQRLEFPPQYGGLLTLGWHNENFTRPIYANELSEGTLRFLWLATLLQSPGLPGVTLIDEPEVSMYPEMLRILADLTREASTRTQLIVVTHSDRFVRFLKPEELVACDYGAGRHDRPAGRLARPRCLDGGLHA